MTDGHSNVRRMPVLAPRGTVYLTGLQFQLWLTLRHGSGRRGRDWTLARFAELTGSSRGRCWHALARLRSLDLIGFRAWPVMGLHPTPRFRRYSPGQHGRLLVWLPRARSRIGALRPAVPTGNDSVSTPSGRFISREGLERTWRAADEGRRPPLPAGRPARDGPRRGRPPRILWSRCPAGHRVHLQRRSWRVTARAVSGRFEGPCRRCGLVSVETIDLVRPRFGRPLSPAELADPGLFAARVDAAGALAGDRVHPELREQLSRDYLEPDLPRRRVGGPEPAGRLLAAWRETLASRSPDTAAVAHPGSGPHPGSLNRQRAPVYKGDQ